MARTTTWLLSRGRRVLIAAGVLLAACTLAGAAIIVDIDQGGGIADEDTTSFEFYVTETGTLGAPDLDLNVRVAISHTWDSDLTATLTSPADTTVTLFSGVGDSGDDFEDTLFDDESSNGRLGSDPGHLPPFGSDAGYGLNHATDTLGLFDSQGIQGTWTLSITDDSGGDTGYLYRNGDTPPEDWAELIGTRLIFTIPEPLTMGVLAAGGAVLLAVRRRRKVR